MQTVSRSRLLFLSFLSQTLTMHRLDSRNQIQLKGSTPLLFYSLLCPQSTSWRPPQCSSSHHLGGLPEIYAITGGNSLLGCNTSSIPLLFPVISPPAELTKETHCFKIQNCWKILIRVLVFEICCCFLLTSSWGWMKTLNEWGVNKKNGENPNFSELLPETHPSSSIQLNHDWKEKQTEDDIQTDNQIRAWGQHQIMRKIVSWMKNPGLIALVLVKDLMNLWKVVFFNHGQHIQWIFWLLKCFF